MMDVIIMVNGQQTIIQEMGVEQWYGQMGPDMMDFGQMIKKQVTEGLFILMVNTMN